MDKNKRRKITNHVISKSSELINNKQELILEQRRKIQEGYQLISSNDKEREILHRKIDKSKQLVKTKYDNQSEIREEKTREIDNLLAKDSVDSFVKASEVFSERNNFDEYDKDIDQLLSGDKNIIIEI